MDLKRITARVLCIYIITLATDGNLAADPFLDYGLRPAACVITDHKEVTFKCAAKILERCGARAVHAFPPDVIFGRFPIRMDETDFIGLSVRIADSPEEIGPADLDPVTLRVVKNLFNEKEVLMSMDRPDIDSIDDLVIRVPEEVLAASGREGPRAGSPPEMQGRNMFQNSEFMIGSVLINLIFPESMGEGEDWTDDEIIGAITGITIGLSEFQQNTHWVDLDFYYNYKEYTRIPVSVEPCEGDWYQDPIWMMDVLRELEYEAANEYHGAHMLNNDTRTRFGTDWAFTAYIADMSNHYDPEPPRPDPNCWGGGGYIAYATLGGPFLVVPYPACRLGYGMGFNRVFIHEMCHVFWALDEYGASLGECAMTSGYLDIPNYNSYTCNEGKTGPIVLCIMQGVSYGAALPVCQFTMGQVGLADENENSIPDIYEVQPVIEFMDIPGGSSDTIYDDAYLVCARVRNEAVPNKNPIQLEYLPGEMIDYAPWLVEGIYWINNGFDFEMLPSDREWDESREDIGFLVSGFEPGKNRLNLVVENCVGIKTAAEKEIFYVGLKYYAISAGVREESIDLGWKTAKEVFGAVFDVIKEDMTSGNEQEIICTVATPDEIGVNSKYYTYRDESIMPGHEYRYRIVGRFEFEIKGDLKYFEYPTNDIYKTAAFPIKRDFVSYLQPNPTRDVTRFTVDIPKSYYDPTGGESTTKRLDLRGAQAVKEVMTPVDIIVYNVLGRHVRTIYSRNRFGGMKTFRWDGRDREGRAVSPGAYFIRIKTGNDVAVRKVMVIR